jgi:hypothetical protein
VCAGGRVRAYHGREEPRATARGVATRDRLRTTCGGAHPLQRLVRQLPLDTQAIRRRHDRVDARTNPTRHLAGYNARIVGRVEYPERGVVESGAYERLRSAYVGQGDCDLAGPKDIEPFMPALFGRAEARLNALGFVPLGYLFTKVVLRWGAGSPSEGVMVHQVLTNRASTIARQMEVGRSSPALPTLITFETYLADGTTVTTLDGNEFTLHLTTLHRVHHSRGLTLEELYADHVQELQKCPDVASAPATLGALAARDREGLNRRRAELEASGLLETAPDGMRRFRSRYLWGRTTDWIQCWDDYRELTESRIKAELARDPNPPPLPPEYVAKLMLESR